MTRNRQLDRLLPAHADDEPLFSKQGQIVAALARSLLERTPGDRITRVHEYAARLDASVGTVQAGLQYLTSIGAVHLEARGRLGTYVIAIDYPLLWSIAMRRPLVGALPLIYSRRLSGLATAVRAQFDRLPIDLELRFIRGAGQRVRALSFQQCDWALLSRHAALQYPDIDVVVELGPETYMAQHVLILRDAAPPGIQDGMRIGVDPSSADHTLIVHTTCRGREVEFIEIDYAEGLRLVMSGVIDGTIWSCEDVPSEITDLRIIPLSANDYPELVALGTAVMVVDKGNRSVTALLGAAIEMNELHLIQNEVLERRRTPSY
ncbi:MAG: hypothetical protein C0183_04590 [Roseiflexus castenholzii]|uniref:GntR family transcriptional regulator YhfZ n=1 Tax=Roseiflexus castenholzii TaxID=120962 RepID=UPI000CB78A1B|nr:MAG: hypothetical protein C0183_04590 [Roseiflexus castenholzii]